MDLKYGGYKMLRSIFSVLQRTNNFHQQHSHIRKNSKTIYSFEQFSWRIFGNAPLLQTLGVIYSIEWALRHCDTVIGECIMSARPSPFSSWQIAHIFHVAYASRATLATQCSATSQLSNMKLPAAETDY
jgi:hypothetical protein